MNDTELQAARQRIAPAYNPDAFGDLAHQFASQLQEHLGRVFNRETPVIPWREPIDNIAEADAALTEAPIEGIGERFQQLLTTMLDRGNNLQHPRYIGHQVPAPTPIAGLFDAVGAVTNQVMAIYEMGPFATAVELALIDKMGEQIGWKPGEFAGLITHGGSLANLTGLLTARNVSLAGSWDSGPPKDAVLVAHADSHYSVTRSAGILGIGAKNVIKVGLDERRRMDPDQLDATLTDLRNRNVPIAAVSAAACATPIGAFDPIRQIAEVCQKHEVWLHVDAAHGGAAIFSGQHRQLLDGLELADSIVIDAHKMMFVPGLCAFVFYKNRDHGFRAFSQEAPYLFDPTKPDLVNYDQGVRTVECTKRAAGFGLWGIWSMFGPSIFGDLVDITFAMTQRWHGMLSHADDFEPLHVPQCNIMTYRHIPPQLRNAPHEELGAFQMKLRRRVIESGEFYLVSTLLDGVGALRNVVINPLTDESDLEAQMETFRFEGAGLSKV